MDSNVDRPLANREDRLFAYIIDWTVVGCLVALLIYASNGGEYLDGLSEYHRKVTYAVSGIIVFICLNAYLLHTRQKTLGKIVMGIRIVSIKDGETLKARPIIIRYVVMLLLPLIPVVGTVIGLVNYLAIARENRRCIHDEIAGTKVIYDRS